MEILFKTRYDFRSWLEQNHDKESELWLIYYKKHTNVESISYNDAVEEALCYGWIDGKVRTIDVERYMQRYTPRRSKSVWSKVNKKRCLKMIAEGKMTEAGFKLIEEAKKSGWWEKAYQTSSMKVELKGDFKNALRNNPDAERFFLSLTDAQKNQYILYIETAKQKETQLRRIDKIMERLEKKMKPGMM
ncbi:MAG: hypothetical protein HN921_12055 [Bacteroidetes bacterium]|jgi:uncharacterized protein YdeI (YjbR/CyaY-like superfamily)|nr:hypothetical protein [Bacteroidota bacterium]